MKRYLVIVSCLSILYAGIAWSLEGCRAFDEALASGHRSKSDAGNSHHHDSDSHHSHSHSGSGELHCQNPLDAFISTQRMSLERERSWTAKVAGGPLPIRSLLSSVTRRDFAFGPPGPVFASSPQRFLLLSVFRI